MLNRRDFIRKAGLGSSLILAGGFPFDSFAAMPLKLTILHTNDVHSRLDAFPADDHRYAGQGGVVARAALIRKIRSEEEHVLLFDSGDIFQGTPYFNLYKGEPEIKAMSLMGYDAATMGNHDFDAGVEGFANQLPHATFPVVTANYEFTGTALEGKTLPYTIFRKGDIRVGVFGLGVRLKGLVSDEACKGTKYLEPIQIARAVSEKLRKRDKCDLVICLSHLGYEYAFPKVSDLILARETEYIDVILGGHTHTFLDEPTMIKNKMGNLVTINQVGWGGVRLGRLDFIFGSKKSTNLSNAQSVIIGKQTRE
jgi:5'-nucleotidase